MNKRILSLIAAVVFTMTSGSAFGMALTTEAQKAAIKEYFESSNEKHTAKAKQLFDLIFKIVPEFYLAELMVIPHDNVIKLLALFCATEPVFYANATNHPELKAILEKYYDEINCKYAFDEGFNTLYSWEQFKIMYMYAIASISKDAEFRKANLEAAKEEAVLFANSLISLKKS